MSILYLLMTVLKFIGIIILIIVIALLIIIASVLIIPIEYHVYIDKCDTMYAKANIRWLYSIITFEIIYKQDQTTHKVFKIFGKRLFSFKKKDSKVAEESEEYEESAEPVTRLEEKKKAKPKKVTKRLKSKNKKEKTKKKKTKSNNILNKILDFKYKKELLEDTTEWIGKILKEIMPSKLSLSLEIGKDDPAETGQLMGMLGALYPFYYSNINIRGNYEKKCFYGILKAKGDFTLVKVLYDLIIYLRKMSVKQMIKLIRYNRREKKHGRKVTN